MTELIPTIVMLLVVIAIVIASISIFGEPQVHRRLAKKVELAHTLFAEDKEKAEEICRNACQRIESFAQKKSSQTGQGWRVYPAGTIPAQTYARSQALLAMLSYRAGDVPTAEATIKQLKNHFKSGSLDELKWLLDYNLKTKNVSSPAVSHYLRVCRESDLSADLREEIEHCMQRACQPTAAMGHSDLAVRLKWLGECERFFPASDWITLCVGQVHVYRDDPEKAGRILTERSSDGVSDARRRLWRARAFAASDRDSAKHRIIQIGMAEDAPADLVIEAATQLFELGIYKDSFKLAKRASTDDQALLSRRTVLMGKAAHKLKDRDTAERLLQKSIKQDPNNADALVALAEIALAKGDQDRVSQVIEALTDRINRGMQSARLQFALAGLLWTQEKYKLAAERFQCVIDERYRTVESVEMLLRCLARLGQVEQMERDAKKYAKAIDPGIAAFLTGTCLLRADRPGDALPYFARAAKHLDGKTQANLLRRVATNRYACYRLLASDHIAVGDFAQAASVLDVMSRSVKPGHADYESCLSDLAETHLRHAIELLKSNDAKGDSKASVVMEKCLEAVDRLEQYRKKPPARKLPLHALAAGVKAKTGNYEEASSYFDVILSHQPKSEFARFGRGLCRLKRDPSRAGQEELRALTRGRTMFSHRAAIALAESHAEQSEFGEALAVLEPVIEAGAEKNSVYYADVCCRSVIYQVKLGRVDVAKQLAARLLTNGNELHADGLIGALLTREGDFEASLPFLESSVAKGKVATKFGKLLNASYRHAIATHCESSNLDAVDDLVTRFQSRFSDPLMDQLTELKTLAREPNAKLSPEIATSIERIVTGSANPEPTLLRNTFSILKTLSKEMILEGDFASAQQLVKRANCLWKLKIEGNEPFWDSYITTFNEGKVHPFSSGYVELQSRLVSKLAVVNLYLLQEALLGHTHDKPESRKLAKVDTSLADEAWTQVKSLVGKKNAVEQFRAAIDVPELVGFKEDGRPASRQREKITWIVEHVDADPQWKQLQGGILLTEALQDLERGLAISFKERFSAAALITPELKSVRDRMKKLTPDDIAYIVEKANGHRLLAAKRMQGPDVWRQSLLTLVVLFGDVDFQYRSYSQSLDKHLINKHFKALAKQVAKQ